MKREYYYIVVGDEDGEGSTWFFPDRYTFNLWFELNEESQYSHPVLDDGVFIVHGVMDVEYLVSEEEVRNRFKEDNC